MCKLGPASRAMACIALLARGLAAQSTVEYRTKVDSLAKLWRPMVTTAAVRAARNASTPLPKDSARFGNVIVRADSGYEKIARAAGKRLAPRVQATYGKFGAAVAREQFVVKAFTGRPSATAVSTGIVDSLGAITMRSNVFADADALESSWSQKVEEIIVDALDPSVRAWAGTTIPIDPPTSATWNSARVELLFSNAIVARECADGSVERCLTALELTKLENPAFTFLTPQQRRGLILANSRIIKRADPTRFDQCANANAYVACDSLIAMIPSDAVTRPVAPGVRQSLVRYALMAGGEGSFDRFAVSADIRQRLEAASKMPAESLIVHWHAKVFDVRSASTAIDVTTAMSSLFWIGLCAALALRSSRWR